MMLKKLPWNHFHTISIWLFHSSTLLCIWPHRNTCGSLHLSWNFSQISFWIYKVLQHNGMKSVISKEKHLFCAVKTLTENLPVLIWDFSITSIIGGNLSSFSTGTSLHFFFMWWIHFVMEWTPVWLFKNHTTRCVSMNVSLLCVCSSQWFLSRLGQEKGFKLNIEKGLKGFLKIYLLQAHALKILQSNYTNSS